MRNAKTVKLFIPHAEIRIFVTDEMIKEFDECKNCSECSWSGSYVRGECYIGKGIRLCNISGISEKMDELIREMKNNDNT